MTLLFASNWGNSGGSDVTDGGAWTTIIGSPTVSAAVAHSGLYSMLCDLDVVEGVKKNLGSSYAVGYARFYVYFTALPAAGKYRTICTFFDQVDSTLIWLELWNNGGTYTWWLQSAANSDSDTTFVPQAGVWYCIELKFNNANVQSVYINGTLILGTTTDFFDTAQELQYVSLGSTASEGNDWVADAYFDDFVISQTYIGTALLSEELRNGVRLTRFRDVGH